MPPERLSIDTHVRRASVHCDAGDRLAASGEHEWAVVSYFYSAYHLIRASLINDPIFDDPTALSRVRTDLTPADRFTSAHHANKRSPNGRAWGVNELVQVLYRSQTHNYERLHQGSIDVRYGSGLRGDAATFRGYLAGIQSAFDAGEICTPWPA